MPLCHERLIRYDRLAAPRQHLGVLVEPAALELRAALTARAQRHKDPTPLLDTTIGELRHALREQLGVRAPAIVSGHQPEFFHPGVFAKNIAAHALARELDGDALFLTVDSDLPRHAQLKLPQKTSGSLRQVDTRIPQLDPLRPYEHQPHVPRAEWLQFFASLGSLYDLYDQSLLRPFAYSWLTTIEREPAYCDAMGRARSATEAELGLAGIREIRVSSLCQTRAFRTFAAHMLLSAETAALAYNSAQQAFRQRHRVRAAGRPVPRLTIGDNHVELPFWLERPDQPRRRLFVLPGGGAVELLAERDVVGRMSTDELAVADRHDHPWPLEAEGWMLRPRALALSAFARLFLADLFIHGIGGAKYDEVMEHFVHEFLGTWPDPMCCISATMHLPLAHYGVREQDIINARRAARDLRYNPQRHLRDLPDHLVRRRAELVRRSERLRAHEKDNHEERRLVWRELRRLNAQMLEQDPWRTAEYDGKVETLERCRELDRIALDREYFYALHPADNLRRLIDAVRAALSPA